MSIYNMQHSNRLTSEGTQSKKVYYLSKKKLESDRGPQPCSIILKKQSPTNIFQMTSQNNNYQTEFSSGGDSRAISLSHCPSKGQNSRAVRISGLLMQTIDHSVNQSPDKKFILPVITESKYNFKPSVNIGLPKISVRQNHERDPRYLLDRSTVDIRNMNKMKYYRKLWDNNRLRRQEKSLLDHSGQKSQTILVKHNYAVQEKKKSVHFEEKLRNRHLDQHNRIGNFKGIPAQDIKGLKGKGKSAGSLFQKMFTVEEVYRSDK